VCFSSKDDDDGCWSLENENENEAEKFLFLTVRCREKKAHAKGSRLERGHVNNKFPLG
jgi:hypothetical protein